MQIVNAVSVLGRDYKKAQPCRKKEMDARLRRDTKKSKTLKMSNFLYEMGSQIQKVL